MNTMTLNIWVVKYDKYINISHGGRMAFAVFLRLLSNTNIAVKYTTNLGIRN